MKPLYNLKANTAMSKLADVLVIGSGSAGAVAAISAAQSKYKVMLIERLGFAGGTSTQMLDTFYGFFTPGENARKIVGGIPDWVVNRLNKSGEVFLRPNTYGAGTGVNYNPERLKSVWDEMFMAHGVEVIYHSTLVGIEPYGEQQKCLFFHKGIGIFEVIAKRVIDATGDADYCHWKGHAYEKAGEKEAAQSLTTTFRMANVDLDKFEKAGGKKMLKEQMQVAVESGRHPLPRKEGSAHEMNVFGCVSTVAVKVAGHDPLDPQSMSSAEIEGRRQAFVFEAFFRDMVAGYENAKIIGLSTQIGVRETRRVYGKYRLSMDDFNQRRQFEDQILICGAPVEDHRSTPDGGAETYWKYVPDYGVYGVPYGCIVPEKSEMDWVVGRCFSATHQAHASCRSMAQTMSMGQAAGQAAVLSLDQDTDAWGINKADLSNRLLKLGAVLEMPQERAQMERNSWSKNKLSNES
ncbi:FAD-dependent oxidoreductase [Persicobacter psychrovividus]|uniref:FAD-dependent oxidoreductase n=1 Tax=Persicobacter psychrovividus TaxID=387638 RepID=A0ABM7VJS5_9BACT|nr:FAD-dependent oxidoreductase [Persicobacter psychrovividus]